MGVIDYTCYNSLSSMLVNGPWDNLEWNRWWRACSMIALHSTVDILKAGTILKYLHLLLLWTGFIIPLKGMNIIWYIWSGIQNDIMIMLGAFQLSNMCRRHVFIAIQDSFTSVSADLDLKNSCEVHQNCWTRLHTPDIANIPSTVLRCRFGYIISFLCSPQWFHSDKSTFI